MLKLASKILNEAAKNHVLYMHGLVGRVHSHTIVMSQGFWVIKSKNNINANLCQWEWTRNASFVKYELHTVKEIDISYTNHTEKTRITVKSLI